MRLSRSLYSKASYEYAIRLPRSDEMFGEPWRGIQPNSELNPESSHNANLELTLEHDSRHSGRYRSSVNGFYRDIRGQIILVMSDDQRRFEYRNVHAARSRGLEGAVGWSAPGGYLELDGNATYIDLRNTSHSGPFRRYADQGLPSRPYLLANGSARGMLRELFRRGDELSLTWYTRYVHGFYVFWEDEGALDSKAKVPDQWTHALVLGYLAQFDKLRLSGTLEAQNLTDARVFDYYGVEKPGRALYFKLTLDR